MTIIPLGLESRQKHAKLKPTQKNHCFHEIKSKPKHTGILIVKKADKLLFL
jgi:hypothetical protein